MSDDAEVRMSKKKQQNSFLFNFSPVSDEDGRADMQASDSKSPAVTAHRSGTLLQALMHPLAFIGSKSAGLFAL
jgi:hypothetical protein